MFPTHSEAIKRFLVASTHADLASLYSLEMECQVNVAKDNGEVIQGEFKGKRWRGYTDGIQTWKPFRIPYNAATIPEYNDVPLKFDLTQHVEAIGMTGWNWARRESQWFAFDFDAITGHSDKHTKKLSQTELANVQKLAEGVPWITVRKSTSGKGLHLYIFPEQPVATANHNEHAALARAILGQLAGLTGFDFQSKVDCVGGNMWVWHRKMRGTDGLTLVKQGIPLPLVEIPVNWPDHVKVVSGQRKKAMPESLLEGDTGTEKERLFAELCGQTVHHPLDNEHKKLIDHLRTENNDWWWDKDNHMLVTHTVHLKAAHTALNLKGVFETASSHSSPINCFLYPLKNGAWAVRRYTPGVKEHDSWGQDGQGWTQCYFNRDPDLASAAKGAGGLEHPTGGYVFRDADTALKSLQSLGIVPAKDLPPSIRGRSTKIKQHRDGARITVEIDRENTDNASEMPGWLAEKTKWIRIFNSTLGAAEPEIPNLDDFVRHLITESGEDYGWLIKSDNQWRAEPLQHVRVALRAKGIAVKEEALILGSSVTRPWMIVNRPFQPEYPGDRIWNRKSAQLRYLPKESTENLNYPHWQKILNHLGQGLDSAVQRNAWAKANGVLTGADYLKLWIASLFQEPTQPLPYLFFWSGPQNTGKSIFHESLELLITSGVVRADVALQNQSGFNAELMHSVLCVTEEIDLSKSTQAYNRIKDWVTSINISIHEKNQTPYSVQNTTHWVQCSNNPEFCPIFPGDTRITMIQVNEIPLEDMIPKKLLLPLLEKEASDFLAEVMSLEIPPSNDRLNIPVIITEDKLESAEINKNQVELFIQAHCFHVPGQWIKFNEFYDRFLETLSPDEILSRKWSKVFVGRSIPRPYIKGRNQKDAQVYVGNISFTPSEPKAAYRLMGEFLVPEAENANNKTAS